jgi:ABC-type multidrug transport system ATPase subunit
VPLDFAVASDGLTKQFRGGQVAVRELALRVPVGAVYGFLGPNGSGKTTTIRMLLGLIRPSAGTYSLLGHELGLPAPAVLSRVGSLVEGPAFHPYLSGWDNLARVDAADRLADERSAKARIGTALERVGLSVAAGKRYRNYSLGMRQRLGIAAALLQPRDLLMLDEPTNGLDPQGTREVRHLIADLSAEGVTVLLSSHLLGEVEQACTHVGVMSAGSMKWQGSMAQLSEQQQARVQVSTDDPVAAARVLTRLGLDEVGTDEGQASAVLGATLPERVVQALVEAGVGVRGFQVARPRLEQMFVELTGEGFDVSG